MYSKNIVYVWGVCLIIWVVAYVAFPYMQKQFPTLISPWAPLRKISVEIPAVMTIEKVAGSIYTASGRKDIDTQIENYTKKNEIENASFLSSFIGNYSSGLLQREEFCANPESQIKTSCTDIGITLSPIIRDKENTTLSGVTISLGWKSLTGTSFKLGGNFVHRIRFSKKGFLDTYQIAVTRDTDMKLDGAMKTAKADATINIPSGQALNQKTEHFEFSIASDSFQRKWGGEIVGNIDIYFFDINASDGNLDVLNLDAFDDDLSYVGSSMSTLWMPLVKAYLGDEELDIWKWITGKGKIQHLERAPRIDLVNVPKNIHLNMTELAKYNIPPFWNMDKENGIWRSSTMKILDTDGNYEFILY